VIVHLIKWLWLSVFAYSPIGKCDTHTDRLEWTRAQRQEAREMASDYLRETGAAPIFVAFVDEVGQRETSWTPSRWHDEGTGLGMHGLNVRYFGEGVNLCDPRESAEVVRNIARRAITKYGAKSAWEIQAIFAGRHECVTGVGMCSGWMQDKTTAAICGRMEHRGFACHDSITERDLGAAK